MVNRLGRCCVVVLLAFLAGCTGGGTTTATTTTTTTTTTKASLRIVQGSPDAGTVDVKDTTAGTSLATAAAYGTVSAYTTNVAAGVHNISVFPTGTSTATMTCTTTTMFAGVSYTLVVAGQKANGIGTSTGLQCQLFPEPAFATPSGQFSVNVHHASPAANAAGYSSISFGTYTPGTTNYSAPIGTAVYFGTLLANLAQSNAYLVSANAVTASPGVGIWFANQTASAPTTVVTTILPSQAVAGNAGSGSSDTTNVLPSGALLNFSIYLVDGTGGSVVRAIGAFD